MAGIRHIVSGIRVAEKRTRAPLWLDRWTNRLVDQNVCVSQAVADFSVREAHLDPQKITVIPNGVDAERFSDAQAENLSEWGVAPGDPIFISVGRLDPQKGLTFLLEAMRALLQEHPRGHLLLVGEGTARAALSDWICEHHLVDSIHLLGWRSDVPELLKSATCLVRSSLWEGMPNVVLEAMASGLPVVATQVEGMTELLQNQSTGILVPPGSASELAAAMTWIIDNPLKARQLGQNGESLVRREFSWQKMVASYEELYLRLLAPDPKIA